MYYGLSEAESHLRVALALLPRRGQVYSPGLVRVRDGEDVPLAYVAVRDPSAVRVLPVRAARVGPARPPEDDSEHVNLVIPLPMQRSQEDGPLAGGTPEAEPIKRYATLGGQAAFIVTVGLRTDREAEFHQRIVLANARLKYADLCEQIEAIKHDFTD